MIFHPAVRVDTLKDAWELPCGVVGVYLIYNLVSGKVYIGSAARSLRYRCRFHRWDLRRGLHWNTHLQRAWDKYGEESFVFRVLEMCEPDQCVKREQFWLDQLKAVDRRFGYNKSPTAGSSRGTKMGPMSEEQKQRRREWNAANRDKVLANLRRGSRTRWSDPVAKEKHLEKMAEHWADKGFRKKMSRRSKRMWADPEYRACKVQSMRDYWSDPSWRAEAIAAMKVKFATPESKAARSTATRRNWDNPEYRKKLLKARRSEETKRRLSESHKRLWTDPIYREKMSRRAHGKPTPEGEKRRIAGVKRAAAARRLLKEAV